MGSSKFPMTLLEIGAEDYVKLYFMRHKVAEQREKEQEHKRLWQSVQVVTDRLSIHISLETY